MYEINSSYGGALFETKNDAINAFFLLEAYHGVKVSEKEIEEKLEKNGYFEVLPLTITKC